MNELYNHHKVKAHISITHGEGFGRPLLEATLSQKPVIAPDWSGQKDFLNPELSTLLPVDLQDVPSEAFPEDIYIKGAQWSVVNYQYASKVLLDVKKNYKKYTLNAKKQAGVNGSRFSLKAMTKKFEKILEEYLPEFEKEVSLKLPKLKKA